MTDPSIRTVLLDTNCFIYLIERSAEPAGRRVESLARAAAAGKCRLVTSSICLSEFLVGVARTGTDSEVRRMMGNFLALPTLEVVPVTNEVAAAAAAIRARSNLNLFDAVVVATGEVSHVDEFVTNDAVLARAVTSLPTTYLNDITT